jgi:uncharacterized protein
VQAGDLAAVTAALAAGGRVNAAADGLGTLPAGVSPLMVAAAGPDARIVSLLLAHGARPAARDANGWTPLHHAAFAGQAAAADRLLARATVDPTVVAMGRLSAADVARLRNFPAMAAMLEGAGADTADGETSNSLTAADR